MPYPVRFGIQTPQQNSNAWPDMLSVWQEVEQLGFDTAWVFDHFLPIFSDPTGPCMEGWTSLAALAMATSQIRLGVMVSGNTYRNPGVLAKIATTVDIISRGRLILGMGGGWFEREHAAFGIPFPGIGERLGRLEESLTVIKQLWSQDTISYTGRYYQLDDAPFLPKPIQQPHPPILVGASGERVALGIVARHADMWNSFGPPALFRHKIVKLGEHCQRIGRDPDTIEKSVLVTGMFAPGEAHEQVADYVDAGVTHIIFSVEAEQDREAIRAFARDVMPAFRT